MSEQQNPHKGATPAFWYVRVAVSGPEPRIEIHRRAVLNYSRPEVGEPRDCTGAIPPAAAAAAVIDESPDDQGWRSVPKAVAGDWDNLLWETEQSHVRSLTERAD